MDHWARMPPPLRERFQAVAEEMGEELLQTAQGFMRGAPGGTRGARSAKNTKAAGHL